MCNILHSQRSQKRVVEYHENVRPKIKAKVEYYLSRIARTRKALKVAEKLNEDDNAVGNKQSQELQIVENYIKDLQMAVFHAEK